MSNLCGSRSLAPVTIAILIGLAIAFGTAGFEQYFRAPFLETGDSAVNALQIANAGHFRELYGNYSRFQFNHPGPAFFYVYAAGEWLFHDVLGLASSPGGAHLFTCVLLQSFFFALALAILGTHLPGRALTPLALLAAALYFGGIHVQSGAFVSIWPPHVLLMPFLCFLLACTSIASGRTDHLPVIVLAGGFLFHGHVAQSLFVGGLGGLALGWAGSRAHAADPGRSWGQRLKGNRWRLLGCAGLGLLFLLPLVIDVIAHGLRSNVATIIGRFYANTNDSKSALQSLLYFGSFATTSTEQEHIFAVAGPSMREFFAEHSLQVAAWSAGFLLTPLVAFRWRARLGAGEWRFFATAYGLLAVTVGLCVLWGMAQAGDMYHFNGYFYYGVYYFGLVLAVALLAAVLERWYAPLLAAVVCAAAAVVFTWSFRLPRLTHEESGLPIHKGVATALQAEPKPTPKLLVFEHYIWPAVAGVALDLERRGVPFYTTPWWEFMFGRRHEQTSLGPTPEEAATVWWITTKGAAGHPISADISIFTEPALLRPDGGEIRFQGPGPEHGNAFRYVVSGVSVGNIEYALTDLPRVVLLFQPEPTDRDVRILFDVQAALPPKLLAQGQPAEVLFNGELIARITATTRAELAVTVPAALWNRQSRGKLELRFPAALYQRSFKRPHYESWAAWNLWKIRFERSP